MGDKSTVHPSSFLTRRHSAGDTDTVTSARLPVYPASNNDFNCPGFMSPEGTYLLAHQIFFRSLTPYYNVGTSASMVSIKYKETTHKDIKRYATTPKPINKSTTTRLDDEDDDELIPPYQLLNGNTIPLSPGYADPSYLSPHGTTLPPFITRSQTDASAIIQGRTQYSPSISTSLSSSMSSYSTPRKPKTNITKTNSSFVQRIITNEQLARILVARTSEDTNLFYNCGSNFVWMDASCRPMEPLSRIIFARAYPTSHDVNLLTRGSDHLDIIIGFTSGDIVWFDPLCNKYGRINKGVRTRNWIDINY
ncbi:hypothetical protein BC941DRAFT_214690 [Chlamydoabsidia padenii]|nr:hypothetical protein BC941DRAFT_214690 [Chlamydoabsidia padenii]